MSQRPREPARNRHPTRSLDILGAPTEAELRASPAVEQVRGRPPRPCTDWATRNAAAFRRARRAGALARGAGETGMQDA
ncbi:hypothetical protein GCM10010519_25440 [Streptomyces lactacystinicus]